MKTSGREHTAQIRDRFTRTAGAFVEFAVSRRSQEADDLAEMATRDFPGAARAVAIDVACGPGTLALPFARRVGEMIGVDITPAMLARGREAADREALGNVAFLCADGEALPFAGAAMDLACCGYAFHHMLHPGEVIRELGRVLRKGGRLAVLDIFLPEQADAEAHNSIERARDASHVATLREAELRGLLAQAGLRTVRVEHHAHQRDFDTWMHTAGWPPESQAYAETRRLLEASAAGDVAGLEPRTGPSGALEFTQAVLGLLAEKE